MGVATAEAAKGIRKRVVLNAAPKLRILFILFGHTLPRSRTAVYRLYFCPFAIACLANGERDGSGGTLGIAESGSGAQCSAGHLSTGCG